MTPAEALDRLALAVRVFLAVRGNPDAPRASLIEAERQLARVLAEVEAGKERAP